MKEFGIKTSAKRGSNLELMEHIREVLNREKGMEKGSFFGEMVSIILENGRQEKNMEVDIGNVKKEIAIWVSGTTDRLMGMEFTLLLKAKDMKDNLKIF